VQHSLCTENNQKVVEMISLNHSNWGRPYIRLRHARRRVHITVTTSDVGERS